MVRISIASRLVAAFVLLALIAAVSSFVGVQAVTESEKAFHVMAEGSIPKMELLAQIRFHIRSIIVSQRTLVSDRLTIGQREKEYAEIERSRKAYREAFESYGSLARNAEEQKLWDRFKDQIESTRKINDKAFGLIKAWEADKANANLLNEATAFVMVQATEANNKLYLSLEDLIKATVAGVRDEKVALGSFLAASERTMYLLLACAPILALLLGCVACRSILGPLKRVVRMAKELSEGNIESRLNLTQKDEIGALAGAMDQLADVLSRLVRQVQESSAKVANGYLRDKVPSEGLKGCFRELVESLNLLVGKVVLMLDSLPTPVMVRDAERRIRFLNKAGGLDLVDVERIHGGLCADHFKTEDCTNGNCACDKAFKTHQKEVSSTVANPTPGVSMDVAYSAIPFGDDSVIEFIIDQSAIQGAQRKLLKTASAAQEVVDVVTSASEELSAQVEQSSRGAEEQSRRIGDTARAMEQMNATVLQVAKNSSESARFADDARRKAQDGNSIVMEVVSSIQLVQQIALRLNEDMDALGRQAAGIGQVVNVISDIADQTNLLALNAAIEAARAGDAGRGFAVVADEVRKLAEKTQTATKEVDASISSMQQGTRQNIANVEEAVKTIEIANRQANASGEALQVIVNLIESASDQVRSIATASEQQSASSEEISQSVENVATISSETADAMRQSAQAVSELAHQAVILRSLIVDMQSNGNRSGEAGPGAREIHGSRKLALVR